MIRDGDLIFSAAQVATDATGASTNVVDLTKAGDAVDALFLVVQIGTACSSAGKGATMKFTLQTDSEEAFGSGGDIVLAEKSFAEALLTANTIVWKIKLPPGCKQYLRLYYTESGEAFTAGTINAYLTPDAPIS